MLTNTFTPGLFKNAIDNMARIMAVGMEMISCAREPDSKKGDMDPMSSISPYSRSMETPAMAAHKARMDTARERKAVSSKPCCGFVPDLKYVAMQRNEASNY